MTITAEMLAAGIEAMADARAANASVESAITHIYRSMVAVAPESDLVQALRERIKITDLVADALRERLRNS